MSARADAVGFYAEHAKQLRQAWAEISAEEFIAPVAAFLPDAPARVLDVGAGIGTLAVWLAGRGHAVTAAEPVDAFHGAEGPAWSTASLPEMEGIAGPFDLILVAGVWQHVPPAIRAESMTRLVKLLSESGQMIMGLRHGPVPDDRPIWANPVDEVLEMAAREGLTARAQVEADAVQPGNRAAGVTFTWLVLTESG